MRILAEMSISLMRILAGVRAKEISSRRVREKENSSMRYLCSLALSSLYELVIAAGWLAGLKGSCRSRVRVIMWVLALMEG